MRTTVSIDDDVLVAAKERASRERRSVGAVISELARKGLTGGTPDVATTGKHGFRPLPPRGPAVSNALIDRLREDEPE